MVSMGKQRRRGWCTEGEMGEKKRQRPRVRCSRKCSLPDTIGSQFHHYDDLRALEFIDLMTIDHLGPLVGRVQHDVDA
jgi:hypothetical protein